MANARIDELRKRLEREPGSRLFAQLAEELRKDGELDEAIRVCREGLQRQPNYPSARMTLGRALFDSGDLRGARAELESVLKGAPDNILAGRLLGECLQSQGERAAALARFKATLALAPGDRQILDKIHTLEVAVPAAEPATILMPPRSAPPAPAPAVPAWDSALPASIETTLIDVPPPFAPQPPVEAEPASLSVTQLESEVLELEEPYRPEPTVVETAEALGDFGAAPAAPATEVEVSFEPGAASGTSAGFEPEPYDASVMVGSPARTGADEMARAATESEASFELEAGSEHFAPTVRTPGPPDLPAGEAAAEAELNTATLAELYLSQGVMDKALEVYRQVLERDPHNQRARTRLAEIEALDQRIRAEQALAAGEGAGDEQAARRRAIERTIAKLEGLLSALRKG